MPAPEDHPNPYISGVMHASAVEAVGVGAAQWEAGGDHFLCVTFVTACVDEPCTRPGAHPDEPEHADMHVDHYVMHDESAVSLQEGLTLGLPAIAQLRSRN